MELLFHRVYEVAEMMAEVVLSDSDPFEELDWESPAINECLNKFSRTSLLGHFCFKHLSLFESRRFRKDPETVHIESIQLAFHRYAIPTMPFEDFLRSKFPEGQDEQEAFHPWMLDQEDAFEQLWNRMTDEVFHILFGNRGFLLNFNLTLAEYRKQRGDPPSPRCAIPQWVKKAVYFRENGNVLYAREIYLALLPSMQISTTTISLH